ncbi:MULTISPECIES: hypothetical protein [unclassified Rhizobium]|jgi:hypothetical protein|uniref:hypothetical protein n=1 Tax=unclassified Rhizobium TaxID=2613769 RepID=UPI000360B0A6|nr:MULTISPECIES: hypothetical protein [unclassified Rhizobium]MBO9123241.1 hypothetical protein [Rhizobium sp. 16-488-2b]MBO9173773.1 hypothetical protein [Rhizobium sp. 16-488-2a]MBO9193572.1 hypothetical protein [Rhizobium sp. 16-449-1b]MDM9647996.1 hypothetical protein [Rhizobium sp. S163]
MPDLKNWYSSKTIWGAVVAILASALHFTGVDIASGDRSQIVDAIVNIAGALGGLLAVYGRVTAKSAIKP